MWLEKTDLECWACGYIPQNFFLPLSRREECTYCRVSLHVCKGCQRCDHTGCTESKAEPVTDPETANFCNYFLVSTTGSYHKAKLAQENARQQLDLLSQDSKVAEIFRAQLGSDNEKSQAEKTLEQLEDLFNPQRTKHLTVKCYDSGKFNAINRF